MIDFYELLLALLAIAVPLIFFFLSSSRSTKPKLSGNAEDEIQKVKKNLSKLPIHLAIIYESPQSQTIPEILSLVDWIIWTGITYVTFYDEEGKLKGMAMQELLDGLTKKECKIFIAGKKMSSGEFKEKINVNFTSREDGKPHFVEAAKEIAQKVKNGEIELDKIDVNLVESYINVFADFPEPNLAIVTSRTKKYFGFPPWFFRLTEIFHNREKVLTLEAYIDGLLMYGKTEQRFGK